ncbi:tol-pal system protein YbgF [Cucumibacter marinus]|uniref:tol-pal system protein YbgF n=1 Tax=Cucumibacter marinus TaxID=1121252 RepID=UPI0004064701|nr:tol-pal system protein YbgF [Cucumibacter marinus]
MTVGIKSGCWTGLRRVAMVLALAGPLAAVPVWAQTRDLSALQGEWQALSQQMTDATRQLEGITGLHADLTAQMHGNSRLAQSQEGAAINVGLDQLGEELRQLTGTIEQMQFRLRQLETQLGEGAGGSAPDQSAPAEPAPAEPGITESAPAEPADDDPAIDENAGLAPDRLEPIDNSDEPPAPDQPAIDQPGSQDNPARLNAGQVIEPQFDTAPPSPDPLLAEDLPEDDIEGDFGALLPDTLDAIFGADSLSTSDPLSLPSGNSDIIQEADADAQFNAGTEAISRRDYAFAADQFRQFIELFPADRRAPRATSLLGEALLQRGEYADAAQVFVDGYETYPQSAEAPYLLVGVGEALAGAGQRETACRTFEEVRRRYPQQPDALAERLSAAQRSNSC